MDKKITDTISLLLKEKQNVLVAIEGPCASGKTTLAKELAENFDCNVFHMDDFYLPKEKRTVEHLNKIGGNIDFERFSTEVTSKIKSNESFTYGIYNCSEGQITENMSILPKQLNIFEGVYCMHPEIDIAYDLKIYLEVDEEEKLKRLSARCPQKLTDFLNIWIPRENKYFSTFNIKENCDLLINN